MQRNVPIALFFLISVILLTGCGGNANEVGTAVMPSTYAAPFVDGPKFGGKRADYIITRNVGPFVVTDRSGNSIVINSAATHIHFDDVSVNLLIADQAKTIPVSDLNTLIELYIAFFNRVPDADGLNYWIAQRKSGVSFDVIAQSFYSAALLYSTQTGYSASMTNEDFVRVIYKNVLGRSGDTAPPDQDVQYWASELKSGRSKASMVGVMLNAAHSFANDPTWSWVPHLLDNKISVGRVFAIDSGLNYNTPEDSITQGMAIAATVTASDTISAQILIPGMPIIEAEGDTTPAGGAEFVLTINIPELIKVVYKGGELQGAASIKVPSGTTPVFDISVHPSFTFVNTEGVNYSGSKLSLAAPVIADRTITIATPKLANTAQPMIYSAVYDRSAMFRDEIGKTSMMIEVFAAVSSNYRVVLTYTGLDPITKQDVTRDIQLFDDGMGVDKRAGDYHFSASLKTELLPRYEYMGIAAYEGRVHVVDSFGNDVTSAGQVKTGMSMVVVDRAKTPVINKLAADVYASASVVNVVVRGTSLRFNSDYKNASFSKEAMKRVLAFFPDTFDEASFFYAGNVGPLAGSEYSFDVKNDVLGIGKQVMDDSSAWGSSGVLRHVSEITGGTTGPFMHELTHRWGFMLNDPRLPLAEQTSCACHFDMYNQIIWDPISAGGGEGIVKTSDGNWMFASYQGEMQYKHSDMMLYLMGLIAPSELPPQPWVIDAMGKLPKGQTIPASKVKLVTAADIEAVYGKRTPEYSAAPRIFRDAIVLISAGRPALPEEMAAVEAQANFYASKGTQSPNIRNAGWQNGLSFYDSTKGRGNLVTLLPPRK